MWSRFKGTLLLNKLAYHQHDSFSAYDFSSYLLSDERCVFFDLFRIVAAAAAAAEVKSRYFGLFLFTSAVP